MRLNGIPVARLRIRLGDGSRFTADDAKHCVEVFNRLVETEAEPPRGLLIYSPFEHDIEPVARGILALRPGTTIFRRFNMGMQ